MAEPPAPTDEASWLDWLKLKRWLQFVRRMMGVEGAIESLKAETKSLQSQVLQMQRELDRIQIQLSTVATITHAAMEDKVRIAVLETVPALVERELARRKKS